MNFVNHEKEKEKPQSIEEINKIKIECFNILVSHMK